MKFMRKKRCMVKVLWALAVVVYPTTTVGVAFRG
jgi:hypothetical protein